MNRCQNCNLPEGKFNVVLNDKGVCNYCEYFEQNRKYILNIHDREQLLARRFQKIKGKYEYDVVVGLSGGKDSTYVLYEMVKKYNLKVLAVTFDNGFLTEFARESIKNTINKLRVDHIYYKPDWNIHKKFYKAAVQKLGDPCIACAIAGYFLAIKGCCENKVPFFVHGRTPFQMYRNFFENSQDMFLALMKCNLMEHSFSALTPIYRGIIDYAKKSIGEITNNPQDAKEITDEFFVDSSRLTDKFVPEFLAYFLFEPYDEKYIKRYLADNLGWIRTGNEDLMGHYDCALHDAGAYLFQELNDVSVLEPDLAVMVRFGALNKEKAEELIKLNEPTENNTERSLDTLCALCEFNREDLNRTIIALRKARVSKKSEYGR
jgi:tRNA(Ile)-lysidine synthase TilS/MesJ